MISRLNFNDIFFEFLWAYKLKVYEQKNNRIYLNGKEIKPRSKDINKATKILDKKIKECIKSGFKKC